MKAVKSILSATKETSDRIAMPTPSHFKKLGIFGFGLIILGVALIIFTNIWPEVFEGLSKYADRLISGGTGLLVSWTAKKR